MLYNRFLMFICKIMRIIYPGKSVMLFDARLDIDHIYINILTISIV